MSDSEGSVIPASGDVHHPHHMGDDGAAAAEPSSYSLPPPTPNTTSDAGASSSSEFHHVMHYLHASKLEDNERRATEEAYRQQGQEDHRRYMDLFTLIAGQLTSSTAQQAPLTPLPPRLQRRYLLTS